MVDVLYVDPPLSAQPKKSVCGGMSWKSFADRFEGAVEKNCGKNCAVFVWSTASNFQKTLTLFKKCGLTFRTIAFVWVKRDAAGRPVYGPGKWTRVSTEYVLLATRGKVGRQSKTVQQILEYPVSKEKPTAVVSRIRSLCHGEFATIGIDVVGYKNLFAKDDPK